MLGWDFLILEIHQFSIYLLHNYWFILSLLFPPKKILENNWSIRNNCNIFFKIILLFDSYDNKRVNKEWICQNIPKILLPPCIYLTLLFPNFYLFSLLLLSFFPLSGFSSSISTNYCIRLVVSLKCFGEKLFYTYYFGYRFFCEDTLHQLAFIV